MQDCFKRNIDYLRVSLTSNCNLRCQYCMPEQKIKQTEEMLSQKNLIHLVELISSTGIKKIRLTGGEPLLYPNIEDLIIRFKAIQGIEKIVLTTNGILLSNKVDVLKKAGISGINLSLDCIDKDLFREITRGGDIDKVILGIKLDKKENIPLKINSVIMQGINKKEIIPLIEFANDNKIDLRFIELMPMNVAKNFKAVKEDDLKAIISKKYGALKQIDVFEGPAHYYQVENLSIKIGFISALSHKFCANCNRLRLTSTGILKPCLHYNSGVNLNDLLKKNVTDEEILAIIKDTIYHKPKNHHLENEAFSQKEDKSMSLIGG